MSIKFHANLLSIWNFQAAFPPQFKKQKPEQKSLLKNINFTKKLGEGNKFFPVEPHHKKKIKSCAPDTWAGRLDDVRGEAFCG
jgi:hypothetical protein